MDPLFTTAPGFDQPIAVLRHCHDRIRKQLATLERLLAHLPQFGANVDAEQAAKSVMKYFNHAAENHHEDEEQDLLPMLQATAQGDDAVLLQKLVPELLQQHRQMHTVWQTLNMQLQAIAAGSSAQLSVDEVRRFSQMYTAHMEVEEAHIAPMAKRIFSDAQMTRLGDAMRARRNITQ
ncbi:hemerythrin domain-containing protein [Noviherbaspirillum cavernae]|uniref:hemerythrin domain-containing protein n=1 Tax=Noviherbaspirillum cavernae TaxID=2320862 RepID=UPI001F5BA846|nr:hemerythrin domain-containing protein [Noviherbaspirillum cavernae]